MGNLENNSSEGLNWGQVDAAVAKFAMKFWGIDTGPSLVPLPQTTEFKLGYLRRTLELAPNLNRQTLAWTSGKRHKTNLGIEKLLKQELTLPPDVRSAFVGAPKTAQEAYRMTQVGDKLHAHMAANQSPIEHVYKSYLDYSDANKLIIPESALRIGHAALELFVFAAGGDEFVRLVQETTAGFYTHQQQADYISS